MAKGSDRPPAGRIPTIKTILAECPWPTRDADAREAARRLASQLQAREYMLWLLEKHPPNLTVAHGVAEMMWARDGVILEEIVCGYAYWGLEAGRKAANDYTTALKRIEAIAPLTASLRQDLDRARGGRNRATHTRGAPTVAADYRRLTPRGLRSKIDFDLPWTLMRALRRHQAD